MIRWKMLSIIGTRYSLSLFTFLIFVTGYIFDRDKMSKKSTQSASEHIQELIKKYPIVMFSKSSCPYCRKAKNVLSKYELGENYFVLELNRLSNTDEYQDELKKITNDRCVPQIFIDGKCIGDEEDLENLDKEGQLKSQLQELKAIEN